MTDTEKWKARAREIVAQHAWLPGRFEREGDKYLFHWIVEVVAATLAEASSRSDERLIEANTAEGTTFAIRAKEQP